MLRFTQWVKEANLNRASIAMNKIKDISRLQPLNPEPGTAHFRYNHAGEVPAAIRGFIKYLRPSPRVTLNGEP
jgi:hypothetical protein